MAHSPTRRTTAITLSNRTGAPIALDPCADYQVIASVRQDAGVLVQSGQAELPCPESPDVVPARGSTTYPLDVQHLSSASLTPLHPGTVLSIEMVLVGIGTSTTTTHVG